MPTFLFDDIIFGPVQSRRMGVSLGVNLLPKTIKYCNFNCIYCECGFTPLANKEISHLLPSRQDVAKHLTSYLQNNTIKPDAITFAGNGEPTIHPDFCEIINDVIAIRNEFAPKTEIVVLTNATQIHKPSILQALEKVDRCMFKLDSAIESTIRAINQPGKQLNVQDFIKHISLFKGKKIIQTLCISGEHNGVQISNITDTEINALIEVYKKINPDEVVLYTIQRDTPIETLQKISKETLEKFAKKVELAGIKTIVS
ncbi:MAG TPA: radical SAM protein [Bacteroidales bacterium]|jgi:wyosine [tRNA(Phe)-imidazoG37] synthetase (radical SAM superfamily)|nr:radical SAM protein [Bacteroidales bacterium]HRS18218.1 radical SAM protein [Bacteroidales bacterium]